MDRKGSLDVIAVNFDSRKVRLIAENKTERNAEAIVMMAVGRRGVDEEYFDTVEHGKYKDGDLLETEEEGSEDL